MRISRGTFEEKTDAFDIRVDYIGVFEMKYPGQDVRWAKAMRSSFLITTSESATMRLLDRWRSKVLEQRSWKQRGKRRTS
jgi:hypothetical protein